MGRRRRRPIALSIRELRLHPEVRVGDLRRDPACPCRRCRSAYKMYYEDSKLSADTWKRLTARLLLLAAAQRAGA